MTLSLMNSTLAARTEGWGRGRKCREEAGKAVPDFLVTQWLRIKIRMPRSRVTRPKA